MSRLRPRRTPGGSVVLLAAAALAVAGPARADEVRATGTVSGDYSYHTGAETSLVDMRAELDLESGPVRLGAVYRLYVAGDADYPGVLDLPENEIKHRFAEFSKDSFSVRAGDCFATFGNGLALRSYEEIELEHDTSLDGVLVELDRGGLRIVGLSGTTSEDVSSARVREHTVRGVRAGTTLAGIVDVAVSGVARTSELIDAEVELPDEVAFFEDQVLGVESSAWIGPVTVSGEYVSRSGRRTYEPDDQTDGHGAYVSASVDLAWATLFGEFKDYSELGHYLVNPPTCVREHLWTLMNRVTYEIDLNDERGFLAEVSAPLGNALYVTGGASEARDRDGDLEHWEIFGHADHACLDWLRGSVAGSWSREYIGNEYGDFTEHISGAVEFVLEPEPGRPVELVLEGQRTNEFYGEERMDYLVSFTSYPGDGMTFSVLAETTDDESLDRDVWTSLELRARIASDVEASFMMGTERGGKKCAGGVCYVEPEFEGFRVRLTSFF